MPNNLATGLVHSLLLTLTILRHDRRDLRRDLRSGCRRGLWRRRLWGWGWFVGEWRRGEGGNGGDLP